MWLALIISLIFGNAALPTPFTPSSPAGQSPSATANQCYQLDESQQITLTAEDVVDGCANRLAGKTFVLIRKQVKIVNSKIQEGSVNWGSCHPTAATGGFGALRKVGPPPVAYPAARPGDIFWEDLNYMGDNLEDFILILTEKGKLSYTFDVYIDQAQKDNLPEFVQNCKEIGGLIPVSEGAATPEFPPKALSLTDAEFNAAGNQSFDNSCCEEEFNKYAAFLTDKYFIRLSKMKKPKAARQIGVITKTIKAETRNYAVFFHAGTIYLTGQADQPDAGKSWMYNPANNKPPIWTKEHTASLQLSKLEFVTVSAWTWATPECKPALYLYPKTPLKLQVKVKPLGKITAANPAYDPQRGWKILAHPNGSLYLLDNSASAAAYPYLYYETELDQVKLPKKGWLVNKADLNRFFTQLLPRLGLTEKEMSDFLAFWPQRLRTRSGNNQRLFIGLIDNNELSRVEPLSFSRIPDTLIRVRFYFADIADNLVATAPIPTYLSPSGQARIQTLTPPARNGFVAVDWGGIWENGSCGNGATAE